MGGFAKWSYYILSDVTCTVNEQAIKQYIFKTKKRKEKKESGCAGYFYLFIVRLTPDILGVLDFKKFGATTRTHNSTKLNATIH